MPDAAGEGRRESGGEQEGDGEGARDVAHESSEDEGEDEGESSSSDEEGEAEPVEGKEEPPLPVPVAVEEDPPSADDGEEAVEEAGEGAEEDGSSEEEDEEEEDDEEEDDEPALKYARLGGGKTDLLGKETASAVVVCEKFIVRLPPFFLSRSETDDSNNWADHRNAQRRCLRPYTRGHPRQALSATHGDGKRLERRSHWRLRRECLDGRLVSPSFSVLHALIPSIYRSSRHPLPPHSRSSHL